MDMKRAGSRYKAFISFDAMFSVMPVLVMLFYVFLSGSFLAEDAQKNVDRQIVFDKLVSIGDYLVKKGIVITEYSDLGKPVLYYPNWIDENSLSALDAKALAEKSALGSLSISMDEPAEGDVCIYRLVVTGPDEDNLMIRQLFVCGG